RVGRAVDALGELRVGQRLGVVDESGLRRAAGGEVALDQVDCGVIGNVHAHDQPNRDCASALMRSGVHGGSHTRSICTSVPSAATARIAAAASSTRYGATGQAGEVMVIATRTRCGSTATEYTSPRSTML